MKEIDKRERMWVHPDFKLWLKNKAASNRMPLIPFTKKVVTSQNPLDVLSNKSNESFKKKKFDFM